MKTPQKNRTFRMHGIDQMPRGGTTERNVGAPESGSGEARIGTFSVLFTEGQREKGADAVARAKQLQNVGTAEIARLPTIADAMRSGTGKETEVFKQTRFHEVRIENSLIKWVKKQADEKNDEEGDGEGQTFQKKRKRKKALAHSDMHFAIANQGGRQENRLYKKISGEKKYSIFTFAHCQWNEKQKWKRKVQD